MTSDIIQNTHVTGEQNRLREDQQGGRGFFGGSGQVFGFLKKEEPNIKKPATNSNISPKANKVPDSNVTALLKTAYKMLKQAERNLATKEERIRALEEILTIDELTSLTNRRGFYRAFEGELDRTNRGENMGGLLIMVDLDHFKKINDTNGHLAGDEALKAVGHFLQSATRPMDVVARLGGDEFIILMPNTGISKAMKRARKIGNDLNDLSFDWKDKTIGVQASLGLKEYTQGDTIESIIEQADEGLYQDKDDRREARKTA